jgi:hypothetical protein
MTGNLEAYNRFTFLLDYLTKAVCLFSIEVGDNDIRTIHDELNATIKLFCP